MSAVELPDFVVAIPARYASTRLPGKPLRLIAGEPMIVHVAALTSLAASSPSCFARSFKKSISVLAAAI